MSQILTSDINPCVICLLYRIAGCPYAGHRKEEKDMDMGGKIKARRTELNITQEALAE